MKENTNRSPQYLESLLERYFSYIKNQYSENIEFDTRKYLHQLAMMSLLLARTAKRIDEFTEEKKNFYYNQFMESYRVWKQAIRILEEKDA